MEQGSLEIGRRGQPSGQLLYYFTRKSTDIAGKREIPSPRPFKTFDFFLGLRLGCRRESAWGAGGVLAILVGVCAKRLIGIGEIARHLHHPRLVRVRCDTGDLH